MRSEHHLLPILHLEDRRLDFEGVLEKKGLCGGLDR